MTNKHSVTQEEWLQKRDMFLCAIIASEFIKDNEIMESCIQQADTLMSKLYEIYEQSELDLFANRNDNDKYPTLTSKGYIANVDYNPMVIDLFNLLPNYAVRDLCIKAHIKSVQLDKDYFMPNMFTLEKCLGCCINFDFCEDFGNFGALYKATKDNDCKATTEDFYNWFPSIRPKQD